EEFGEVNTIQGIQDPLAIFSGPVSLTTKVELVQADTTLYNDYTNITQPTFDVKAVKGLTTAQNGIEIHLNQANFDGITILQTGQAYVKLSGSIVGIANTT